MKNKTRILSFLALPLLLTSCLSKSDRYDNIEEYNKWLESAIENSDFHSELYIFPSEINKESAKNFMYRTSSSLFSGAYFFYLVMEYDETAYNNEITRLADVKATYANGEVKTIIHSEERKAYISIQQNNRHEYAYYDETNHIIAYVSNQLYDWGMTGIDKEYYIGDIEIENKDMNGGYNIYYRYEGDVGYYIKDNI